MSEAAPAGSSRPVPTRLSDVEARERLARLTGWAVEGAELVRVFTFKNYYQTTAFVNAVAWIAHAADHHPDISFGYKTCSVRYTTHEAGGLSEKDFACAEKIDALLGESRGS
ncbi:MAG: 4a-hydroxytetrahydrobiopterin dehydratase [Kiritimatiellae bacterium]|nr:4a-hydroxytetrahydrobiopterin dehydratase [Kiritimatiellia bacterium]MCO5067875.1 4a-hydroxytetrahydrobiopterin dehydratase [Kiritimatiellia bacterium]